VGIPALGGHLSTGSCLWKGVPHGQQRRQFSPEFKGDAVALVRSSGRPIAQIAKELGIGESNLSYWLAKDREERVSADPERFAAEVADSDEVKRRGGGTRARRDRSAVLL
jgi:transposase